MLTKKNLGYLGSDLDSYFLERRKKYNVLVFSLFLIYDLHSGISIQDVKLTVLRKSSPPPDHNKFVL